MFFTLEESTMAALRRTDDTEIAAVVATRNYEGEGWRKKERGGGGKEGGEPQYADWNIKNKNDV